MSTANSGVTAGTSKDWEEMTEVRLPKAPKTEQNFQFVGVKGKSVKVPKPVAEVLANSEAAREAAEEYENGLAGE